MGFHNFKSRIRNGRGKKKEIGGEREGQKSEELYRKGKKRDCKKREERISLQIRPVSACITGNIGAAGCRVSGGSVPCSQLDPVRSAYVGSVKSPFAGRTREH